MPSLIDVRLREHGTERRVDATTEAFVIASMLLRDTPLVCIVQERLGRIVASSPPPAPLLAVDFGLIVEAMYWSPRSAGDPAHRWLRSRFVTHAQRVSGVP